MDQVSRPLLVVLAATIAVAALWLVALRPKSAAVAGTPAAPVQAVDDAKGASAASAAATAKVAAATGGGEAAASAVPAAAPSAAATAPAPTADPADVKAANRREAAVLRDIDRGKVVLMLFWNPKGADDVATRAAVAELDRRRGRVAVHVIPVSRVGQYPAITRGITINQSPTTLIVDRKRHARSIVGLSERGELTQAVDDALAGRR
ncbi:MAG TPA: hypothetical protein VG474_04730 [Solirubrobacteraceae bacterium]|nr:hypothetical protein [Solirubrobacteraceae bacterium]